MNIDIKNACVEKIDNTQKQFLLFKVVTKLKTVLHGENNKKVCSICNVAKALVEVWCYTLYYTKLTQRALKIKMRKELKYCSQNVQ